MWRQHCSRNGAMLCQRIREQKKPKNAKETTYFVVQMFMDKFNQEADALKSQD